MRAQTRESHHRVDHLIGALDLTSLEGMSDFLATNYLAYSSVKERLKPYEGFTLPLLPLDEIEADLDVLGRSVPRWRVPPFGEAMHPVGMIYVLAGSRLGATVLRQKWEQGECGQVRQAGRFLDSLADRTCWTGFLRQVAAAQIGDMERIDIVDSANACFAIFEAAYLEVTRETANGPIQS